jgi:hypothetical protein
MYRTKTNLQNDFQQVLLRVVVNQVGRSDVLYSEGTRLQRVEIKRKRYFVQSFDLRGG